MEIDKLGLLSKGWSTKEIAHASQIIEEAENRKHIGIKFLDKSIYVALIFLLLVTSIICSIFLVPFILVIKSYFIILIVSLLGFAFGVIFSILLVDTERLVNKKSKKLLWTLIISGVFNAALIIEFSTRFSIQTSISLTQSPYLIGGMYLFSYLTPHIVFMIQNKNKGI
jgi:ABC-type multidrug transport system permease subunit